MHTRLQFDPAAQFSLRHGDDGDVELVVLDPASDNSSCVLVLTPDQLDAIRTINF